MNERDPSIDVLKGVLCVGMVIAHAIQFLGDRPAPMHYLGLFFDLVSFSGFLFSFGFGTYLAYIRRSNPPWRRALSTSLKCYIAFVLSGTAYRLFVSHALDLGTARRIALLRDIPHFSEFLLSFAIVALLGPLLRPVYRQRSGKSLLALLMAASTLACFLPATFRYDPWVELFLGGSRFAYFPVLPYLSIYIAGTLFAKHEIRFSLRGALLSGVGALLFLLSRQFGLVSRFPPSLPWVVGSFSFVYLLYGGALWLGRPHGNVMLRLMLRVSTYIGSNVLYFLLLTNGLLFALPNMPPFSSRRVAPVELIVIVAALFSVGYFLHQISTPMRETDRRLDGEPRPE